MADWPEYLLDEVAFFQEGPGILAKDFAESGTALIRLAGLGGYEVNLNGCNYVSDEKASTKWKHFKLEKGDILVSTSASFGRPAVVGSEAKGAIFYTGIIRFRSKSEQLDDGYLKLFLGSKEFDLQAEAYASGSVIRHFGPSHLRQMTIQLPPIDFQRQIVGLISALDDKIELNRRMNETLESMGSAIFKDWFVDFGPTRAKAEGREPYLAAEIWDLFPDVLDDEDKPSGWQVSLLGERVEILDSKRIPLSSREREQRPGPYPYHGATGVMDYVDDFLFEGVHVLLGEDGSVVKPDGRPFTQYVWGQFWVNNHAHVLRGYGISSEMLLCFLQQTDIAPFVTGAVQPKLNQKNLKGIPFPASSSDAVEAFDNVVSPLFEQVRFNTEQTRTLSMTRDYLLPKLMSGEVHVRDAEKAVGNVA